MDLIDKKILCELDMNCRAPLARIGRKLRIGRNVVLYRTQRLEEAGIIHRYICSVNLGIFGYRTYKVYFRTGGGPEEEFVKHLVRSKSVVHCLKTEGAYSYSAAVAVRDIRELDEFLTEVKSRFHSTIKEYFISILVYSKVFKLNKLLLGEKAQLKAEQYTGGDERADLDAKGKSILRTLSQEANLPITEIAKRTALSVDVVKYRLRRMHGSTISSYRVMLDLNRIGFHHYLVMLRTVPTAKSQEERLVTWCTLKPSVIYCSKKIGPYDFEINVAIASIDELNDLLAELKREFGGIIDEYELVINTRLLKLNYVPF